MASFVIRSTTAELCDGVRFRDVTGSFSVDNPMGYGAPPDPGPVPPDADSYDTYTLQVWAAQEGGVDVNAAPNFTFDLLTFPHTTDPVTGYVTWDLSFADLGGAPLRSGWWVFRTTGVYTNSDDDTFTYTTTRTTAFIRTLQGLMDEAMLTFDPDCQCGEGCVSASDLYITFRMARDFMGCCADKAGFTKSVDWLYNQLPLCC